MSPRRGKTGRKAKAKKAPSANPGVDETGAPHDKDAEPAAENSKADKADDDDDVGEDAAPEQAEPQGKRAPEPEATRAATPRRHPNDTDRPPRTAHEMGETSAALAARRWFRLAISAFVVCMHLLAFRQAGHSRLGINFNEAPDAELAFTDLNAPSTRIWPRQPHNWARLVVSRWDAQHYIGTAVRGLSACPSDPSMARDQNYLDCGLGWLPAYGWAGGVVSSVTGLQADYALLLLSCLAALAVNLLLISDTLIARLGKAECYFALLAFNLYPSAFFVVTPLTEGPTIALVLGGFIAVCKERWVLAGVLVGASTALRLPTAAFAFALGCTLLFAAWQRYRVRAPKWWKPLVAIPLCGWGQFMTMLVLQLKLGDWLAFFTARKVYGDKSRLDRFTDPTYFLQGIAGQAMDMFVYLSMLAIVALTWRRVIKRFSSTENVFLITASLITILLVPISATTWWGISRYMMMCLIAFFGLGIMGKSHRLVFALWLVLSAAFYWHVELCEYITHGDTKICPCSGRSELHMPPGKPE